MGGQLPTPTPPVLQIRQQWCHNKRMEKSLLQAYPNLGALILIVVIVVITLSSSLSSSSCSSSLWGLPPLCQETRYKNKKELAQTKEEYFTKNGNCVFVPGGGFSGFWYILGNLQYLHSSSLIDYNEEEGENQHYYCYSAGCLSVVAVLFASGGDDSSYYNSTHTRRKEKVVMEKTLELASNAQSKWKSGEITRFEVVPYFVDELLHDWVIGNDDAANNNDCKQDLKKWRKENEGKNRTFISDSITTTATTNVSFPSLSAFVPPSSSSLEGNCMVRNTVDVKQLLSRIHIITTSLTTTKTTTTLSSSSLSKSTTLRTKRNINTSIQTPETIQQLKDMLIQTTWIPHVTGEGAWSNIITNHSTLNNTIIAKNNNINNNNSTIITTIQTETYQQHMDGFFSYFFHPNHCTKKISIPNIYLIPSLIWNVLNVDLSTGLVGEFWNAGIDIGRRY